MISIETIRIKFRRFYINKTAKIRRKNIYSDDFTIISNNCWAGFIYQSYNLKYNSPTIGLFFMAEDYIKFLKDIKRYMYMSIKFIRSKDSKWYEELKDTHKFGEYPIGVIGDIEIHFLHYKNEEDAVVKWQERVSRINWNKIIIKFNDQNLCTIKHIEEFCNLPYKNKICFTSKQYIGNSIVHIKSARRYNTIPTSYEPFGKSKNININNLINNL